MDGSEAVKMIQRGLMAIEGGVREAIPAAERVIIGASRNASGQSASADWVVAAWIPGPGGRIHIQAQGPELRAVVEEVVSRATSTAAACPSCGRQEARMSDILNHIPMWSMASRLGDIGMWFRRLA